MRTNIVSPTLIATVAVVLGWASVAGAEDAPAAPAEPAPGMEAAPAADATPSAPAAPSAEPAKAAEAQPAPAEKSNPIASYFRIDQDYLFGLQFWAGATFPLSDTVGLATDVYMPEVAAAAISSAPYSYWGEFDIGPAFTLGPVSLTPMAGIAFDWSAKRAVALNAPQLYTIVSIDKLYFESWVWTVLYSPFKDKVWNDYIHTRDWILYKLSDVVAVGPQFEYMYYFKDYTSVDPTTGASVVVNPKGTAAMPIGAHVELGYGTGNSLGIFVGYELEKKVRETRDGNGLTGRLSFVHTF